MFKFTLFFEHFVFDIKVILQVKPELCRSLLQDDRGLCLEELKILPAIFLRGVYSLIFP